MALPTGRSPPATESLRPWCISCTTVGSARVRMPTRHGPDALRTTPPPHPRRSKNGSRHYVRTYSPAVWTPGRTPHPRAHRNIAAIHNDHATVINADTGEVLTEHTLEATRTYQRKNG